MRRFWSEARGLNIKVTDKLSAWILFCSSPYLLAEAPVGKRRSKTKELQTKELACLEHRGYNELSFITTRRILRCSGPVS